MATSNSRYLEAVQIWDWIQWRLPADLWLEAQQSIRDASPPVVQDPALVSGLAELQNAGTTRARKLQLLGQLLTIIKNHS
jgi:hypothetical protein